MPIDDTPSADETRQKYYDLMAEHLGVDLADLDRETLDGVPLAALAAFVRAVLPSDVDLPDEDTIEGPFSAANTNTRTRDSTGSVDTFPALSVTERLAELEREAALATNCAECGTSGTCDCGTDDWTEHVGLTREQQERGRAILAQQRSQTQLEHLEAIGDLSPEEQAEALVDVYLEHGRDALAGMAAVDGVHPRLVSNAIERMDEVTEAAQREETIAWTLDQTTGYDRGDLEDMSTREIAALGVRAVDRERSPPKANYRGQRGAAPSPSSNTSSFPSLSVNARLAELEAEREAGAEGGD